jgi:hypothetical protein
VPLTTSLPLMHTLSVTQASIRPGRRPFVSDIKCSVRGYLVFWTATAPANCLPAEIPAEFYREVTDILLFNCILSQAQSTPIHPTFSLIRKHLNPTLVYTLKDINSITMSFLATRSALRAQVRKRSIYDSYLEPAAASASASPPADLASKPYTIPTLTCSSALLWPELSLLPQLRMLSPSRTVWPSSSQKRLRMSRLSELLTETRALER